MFNADQNDQLRLGASLRRDFYQSPNSPAEEAVGVHDAEQESDAFVNFSWARTAGHGVLLTLSPFFHFNRADYLGGPNDMPVSPLDKRASAHA